MKLIQTGETFVKPSAKFYWDRDSHTTVEIVELTDRLALIRASKSYRLLKQDTEGQENWDANLRTLNDHLADTFPAFQISVNYVNEVTPDATTIPVEIQDAKDRGELLWKQKAELEHEVETLQGSAEFGIEAFEKSLAEQAREKKQHVENIDQKLDRVLSFLEQKKREYGEWRQNGVMLAYLFSFSTEPEIVQLDEALEAAEHHVQNAFNYHRRKVKQTLQGTNWKLVVETVEEPRILNRLEHTTLLNPESFGRLIESHPDLEKPLKNLQQQSLKQYEAFALQDLEVDNTVFERSKATPAQAVNGLLQSLESENVARSRNAPNNGPYVGNIAGTHQVVGFDPAEIEHYYLAGKSGAGKTGLKRVLLENAASLGYNILSIVPTDKEGMGICFPNPTHENGRSLNANQYWPDHDRLLDWPSDTTELFNGINVVTLHEVDEQLKQQLVYEALTALYEHPKFDTPLFLFLEEAQNFDSGETVKMMKSIVKEKRKHNVHMVIITQNPKQFKRTYADIRRNTTTVFLHGEYFSYADDFDILESKREVASLDRRQAIFHSMDWDRFTVDIRDSLTWIGEPSQKQIEQLDRRFSPDPVQLSESGPGSRSDSGSLPISSNGYSKELTSEEQELLDFIHEFIENTDNNTVSASNCHRQGPANSKTARKHLNNMVDKGFLKQDQETRNHNECDVFKPV